MFLDLMNGMISVLTVLSPTEVLSICSVTTVLKPSLDSTPVSSVFSRVSSIVLVVVRIPHPRFVLLRVFLILVLLVTVLPVQLVSQAFQTIGANPVCGSTFSVRASNSRVEL